MLTTFKKTLEKNKTKKGRTKLVIQITIFVVTIILVAPPAFYVKDRIMDCYDSYEMTENFSKTSREAREDNPESDKDINYNEKDGSMFTFPKSSLIVSEQAYNLCRFNHQAEAWYYALNVTNYDEMKKGFDEINKSRFDKTNSSDWQPLRLLYYRRISMENNFDTKINLIIEKNKISDNCRNYTDIIKYSINYKELNIAKEWLDDYETKPNMVNNKYTCSEGDRVLAEEGRFVDDYINYLILKIKYHHLNNEPQQRDEFLNKLVDLQKNPNIGNDISLTINIDRVNQFIEEN